MHTRDSVGLLDGLRPFLETSIRDDLKEISAFFGVEPTSRAMAKLVGSSPSSLSRAATEGQAIRTAGHIAVLASLAMECRQYFATTAGRGPVDKEAVARWLHSGRLWTSQGFQAPIDALSQPAVALAALNEVRTARFASERGISATSSDSELERKGPARSRGAAVRRVAPREVRSRTVDAENDLEQLWRDSHQPTTAAPSESTDFESDELVETAGFWG